jgi:hypothetical protein
MGLRERWPREQIQPRSGVRMQPRAQALGRKRNGNKPERAKEKHDATDFRIQESTCHTAIR